MKHFMHCLTNAVITESIFECKYAMKTLEQYLTQCRLDQYSRKRRTQEGSQEHRLLYVFSIVFLWISPKKTTGKRRSASRRTRCRSRAHTKTVPRCSCVRPCTPTGYYELMW